MDKKECVDLTYVKGDFSLFQGKKGNYNSSWKKNGTVYTPKGNGWGTAVTPSKLTLTVKNDDKLESVNIKTFFKENEIRLTQNRIQNLKATMPTKITIDSTTKQASEKDLKDWCERAKIKIK